MTSPARSWLYVLGSRRDRVAKALTAGADAVVLDLEDSASPQDKATARACAVDVAGSYRPGQGPQFWVRVNDPEGEWGAEDLRALRRAPLDGLRVPRARNPSTVRNVADTCELPLLLLLEFASGLMGAHELATAHPLVTGIGGAERRGDARTSTSSDVLTTCGTPPPTITIRRVSQSGSEAMTNV